MKAALLESKQNIVIRDIPEPQVNFLNNVLIKVDYCGICGSDISKYFNRNLQYPILMGHEVSGKVIKGPQYLLNKQVSIIPKIPCYECEYCKQEKYNLCQNKFTIGSKDIGAFAEYIAVPEKNVLPIELNNIKLGVLIEPLANAFHVCSLIKNIENLNIGIVGLGNIGSLVKNVLNLYYNKQDIVCVTRETNIEELLNKCDCVIESSGKCAGLSNAINICKPEGQIIQVSIIYPEELNSDLQYDKLNRKELNIKGSFDFNLDDWNNAYNLIKQYPNEFINILGEEYKLQDINQAFNVKLKSNKKLLIKL